MLGCMPPATAIPPVAEGPDTGTIAPVTEVPDTGTIPPVTDGLDTGTIPPVTGVLDPGIIPKRYQHNYDQLHHYKVYAREMRVKLPC